MIHPLICPADKGKAIVIEDRDICLSKMQDQLKKLTTQLKIMDIDLDNKKERYNYLSSAPVLANMYLLIKVHRKTFQGEQ